MVPFRNASYFERETLNNCVIRDHLIIFADFIRKWFFPERESLWNEWTCEYNTFVPYELIMCGKVEIQLKTLYVINHIDTDHHISENVSKKFDTLAKVILKNFSRVSSFLKWKYYIFPKCKPLFMIQRMPHASCIMHLCIHVNNSMKTGCSCESRTICDTISMTKYPKKKWRKLIKTNWRAATFVQRMPEHIFNKQFNGIRKVLKGSILPFISN